MPDTVSIETILKTLAVAVPGIWALVSVRREALKTAELANFDYWISDRAKILLNNLSALSEAYQSAFIAKEPDLDDIDRPTLNRLTTFSARILNKYHGVAYGNEYFLKQGNWAYINATKELNDAFTQCCNDLEDSIVQKKRPEDISRLCQDVEFHFSDMVMLLRYRITRGHGIFKWWVFRAEYRRK